MGRYGDIAFLPESRVPAGTGDLLVRESWRGHLIAGLLLLAVGIGVPALVFFGGGDFFVLEPGISFHTLMHFFMAGITGLVILGIALTCPIAGLVFLCSGLAALRPTNWVLRAGREGLYVKLRSYLDHRLPSEDPVVAFIPKREVRWLQAHEERARHVSRAGEYSDANDDARVRQQYLEIKLFGEDLSEIDLRLKRERSLKCPTLIRGVTSQARGTALSLRPGGVLRIDWTTKRTRLRPGLAAALERLARDYRTAPERESEQAAIRTLDRARQEERLLEMVEQGNVMDAVILARDLYGFDLSEAKTFLDELQRT